MSKILIARLLSAVFILCSFGFAVWCVGALPDRVAVHWNMLGQPDGYMARLPALLILPVMTLVLVVLLQIVPRLDPLRKGFSGFRPAYEGFIATFAACFLAVQAFVVAFNAGYPVRIEWVLAPVLSAMFVSAGVLLMKTERNWFAGIRTPWTLQSDSIWKKTHRLGGVLFIISGGLSFIGLAGPVFLFVFAFVPVMISALVPVVYSYVCFRRETAERKQ
jgi:uncharacterized membrane protein